METYNPSYVDSRSLRFPDPPQLPPTRRTSTGATLLHTAVLNGYTDAVDQLLSYGASIEAFGWKL